MAGVRPAPGYGGIEEDILKIVRQVVLQIKVSYGLSIGNVCIDDILALIIGSGGSFIFRPNIDFFKGEQGGGDPTGNQLPTMEDLWQDY